MSQLSLPEMKKALEQLNTFVITLDSNIRAVAFDVLLPYYVEGTSAPARRPSPLHASVTAPTADTSSRESFFNSFSHDKAAENVHLIVAWLYSQHGVVPLSAKTVRDLADEVGLTIPARPDATMYAAMKNGKSFYHKKGNGYQLTVHGEAHLKATYGVKKGTKPYTEPAEGA